MIKAGLTGGLACGKSTVGEMFARRGAHLVQADAIAHELMRPGQPVYEEVVQRFGREVVAASGEIDRAKLAAQVFAGGRIAELNAIVHPAVIREQEAWMEAVGEREPGAVAMVEAALIFEAGLARRFDTIVVVTCGREQKLERYARRVREKHPETSEAEARAEAERRMAAQMPDEEKVAQADYVIENSGTREETERQVERVWQQLQRAAEERQTRTP